MADGPRRKVMGETAPDHAWLALVREEALEPELEIVDPHHHLWVRPGQTYFAAGVRGRSGRRPQCRGYGICRMPLDVSTGRTRRAAVARRDGIRGRMRGHGGQRCVRRSEGVPGDVRSCRTDAWRCGPGHFERHIERSGGRFKGARYSTAWDAGERIPNVVPDRHRLLEPSVRRAVAVMAEMGLGLDVWVYHPQLDDVVELAAAYPGLTIILNHTGAPILGGDYRDRREEVFRDWRRGIERVAVHGNVFVKLGALPIRRPGDGIDRSLPPTSDEVARLGSPGRTSASRRSGRRVRCSNRTFRCRSSGPATRSRGTRSNGSRPAAARTKSISCSRAQPDGPIGLVDRNRGLVGVPVPPPSCTVLGLHFLAAETRQFPLWDAQEMPVQQKGRTSHEKHGIHGKTDPAHRASDVTPGSPIRQRCAPITHNLMLRSGYCIPKLESHINTYENTAKTYNGNCWGLDEFRKHAYVKQCPPLSSAGSAELLTW